MVHVCSQRLNVLELQEVVWHIKAFGEVMEATYENHNSGE